MDGNIENLTMIGVLTDVSFLYILSSWRLGNDITRRLLVMHLVLQEFRCKSRCGCGGRHSFEG